MPKTSRIELRVAPELRAAIDAARGDVSLNRWCERALEAALGGLEGPGQPSGVPAGPVRTAAPHSRPTPPPTLAPRSPTAPQFNRATSLRRD